MISSIAVSAVLAYINIERLPGTKVRDRIVGLNTGNGNGIFSEKSTLPEPW
ncbi:hypothetical protein ACFL45_10575 [Candidatus Neomarinimicrobiota bacterium]